MSHEISVALETPLDKGTLSSHTQMSTPTSLVFVDAAIPDVHHFTSRIQASEVVLLNSEQSGIEQITQTLQQRRNVTDVHIISHGEAGSLQLGNTLLNEATLAENAPMLRQWQKSFTTDADLFFYGCNVAADRAGLELIHRLSQFTGADVAASDDLTGQAGDWSLEVTTGAIEAGRALPATVTQTYEGTLAIYRGNEYVLTSTRKTWRQAQAEARQLGGHLVTINNRAEQSWLRRTFGNRQNFWIGLNDLQKEGRFRWVSGEASSYRNWEPGVPTRAAGRKADVVLMQGREKYRWDDVAASQRWRGIIEFDQPRNPNPNPNPDPNPNPNPGIVALESTTYSVNESAGSVSVSVVRTGNINVSASAQYSASNGTAVVGSDFAVTSGVLSFAPGETRKSIVIPIINDINNEGNENFGFVVEALAGTNLGLARTATITIVDDDTLDLTLEPVQVNESAAQATVTVSRGNATGAASVDYGTQNGTATAGSDYTAVNGTLNFAAGEFSKTINIPILNDTTAEFNETFQLRFSNPNGVTLGNTDSALITILDNDAGNFTREDVVTGLAQPTAFARTPDSRIMYIAEKAGRVRIFRTNTNTLLPNSLIDLSSQVNSAESRGLLGITVHPEFYTGKPYLYLAYTYDPPEAAGNPDQLANRPARIVRITLDAATDYTTVVANSMEIILGKNSTWANISNPDKDSSVDTTLPESGRNPDGSYVQDYLKVDSAVHSIGNLGFGADGALYVTVADGTAYNSVDPRAASVLNPDSLSGKMLRVDALTGQGLPDNPFYNGDPNSNRSKVWNSGMRNPFRFTFKPGTSLPFIGDVGWRTWEEVNVGVKGANFGWPAYEGGRDNNDSLSNLVQPDYDDLPPIQTFLNSSPSVTAPIFARNHSEGARAIIMGDFYDGTLFPGLYQGALFVADVGAGTVDALRLDDQNRVTAVSRFDSGLPGITYMETGADGYLYYVNIGGTIGRWRPV